MVEREEREKQWDMKYIRLRTIHILYTKMGEE